MKRRYPFTVDGGDEPPLADLLTDPTLHLLLARDGLVVADVCAAITDWRARCRPRPVGEAA